MSTEEKPKIKVPVTLENSMLQAAIKQSVILPIDALAKAKTEQNPSSSIPLLQAATTQCATLPQNRIVVRESIEDSAKKS
jgi:hypothetical protein